jgi:hypothetical protein
MALFALFFFSFFFLLKRKSCLTFGCFVVFGFFRFALLSYLIIYKSILFLQLDVKICRLRNAEESGSAGNVAPSCRTIHAREY